MPSRRAAAALRQPDGSTGQDMRRGGASWRVLTGAAVAGWTGLALFHVWLLWGQWQDGRLSDPVVAAKWAGSALLLGALAFLYRSGGALVFGRQALVVWMLAALVHVGAGQPGLSADPSSSSPALLFIVPSLAGAALLVGSALLAAARRARRITGGIRLTPPLAIRVQHCSRLVLARSRALRAPPLAIA